MKKLFFLVSILFFWSCLKSKANNDTIVANNKHISIESREEIVLDKKLINKQSTTVATKKLYPNFLQNNDTEIGVIKDKDGYTNIREQQNTSSKIIGKIKEDEYFFYNIDPTSDWYLVKDLYQKVGYIHKSRIEKVEDDKLYSLSLFEDYSDFETKAKKAKDTIVELKDLDVFFDFHYTNTDFNYSKLELVNKDQSSVVFKNQDYRIKISKSPFISSKHKIKNSKDYNNVVQTIDGKEFHGTDGGIPRMEYSEIEIIQKGISFKIPKSEIDNLYEPNFRLTSTYYTNDGRIIIMMHNSDGAGAYSVIFIVKKGALLKKIVYILF